MRETFTPRRIQQLRAETPGTAQRIHLNNAGASLMPDPVASVVETHWRLERSIGGYEAAEASRDAIGMAYRAVADLIGCRRENVAFVDNATAAFAQALSAVPFRRGDVILTTRNDYVSNQLMYLSLARRAGVEVVRAPDRSEGGVDVDAMRALIRRRHPRLVAVTHVPTNSGLVQDVEAVGQACADANALYLVDACQSVGQLPIDAHAIRCDFLAATSRKFLRGPRGSGFLFASDRVLGSDLEPLFIDLQGATWTGPDTYERSATAQRFETWEFAYGLVLGTGAAARYARALGIEAIERRVSQLAERLRCGLREIGLRVLDRGLRLAGIVSVAIPGWEPAAFADALRARRINTAISRRAYAVIDSAEKGVAWSLRISPHYYNTEDEIAETVAVIGALVTRGGG